ncbi:hypothetical protein [Amycolatopsis minnesotensis]|uniref:Secreted protein n=1 Tax=Amycolatopsis minnesotensis TaxID=337894 RepID=A0ABN2R795_9PSEU
MTTSRSRRTITALAVAGAAAVAAGTVGITVAVADSDATSAGSGQVHQQSQDAAAVSHAAAGNDQAGQNQPPKGARATVEVTPNPTAKRGQEVTITGSCGGGTGLKTVVGGLLANPSLVDVQIVDPGPDHYVAKAKLAENIGNGVGPVLVDCGGEAGVTLLVTHV